jgi:hypothetical protein
MATFRGTVERADARGIFVNIPDLGYVTYGPLETVVDDTVNRPGYVEGDRVLVQSVGTIQQDDFVILGHRELIDGTRTGFELPTPTPEDAVLGVQGGAWRALTALGSVTPLTEIHGVLGAFTSLTAASLTTTGAISAGSITGSSVSAPEATFTDATAITLGNYGSTALSLGTAGANNLGFDATSVQARNNGATSPLKVNPLGGNVVFGTASNPVTIGGGTISANGSISATLISTNGATNNSLTTAVTGQFTSATALTLGNATSTPLNVGTPTGTNIGVDAANVQARNNGAASTLSLNPLGGNITLGAAGSTISLPGTLSTAQDAGIITTGTFATARIPNLDASKTTSGTFATARIPNLDASVITTGRLDNARAPFTANYASGTDLNTYTTPGVWRVAGNADAVTSLNFPADNQAGILVVWAADGAGTLIQMYFHRNGVDEGLWWHRACQAGTWKGWYEHGSTLTPGFPYRMAAGTVGVSHPASTLGVTGVTITLPTGRFSQPPVPTVNLLGAPGGSTFCNARIYAVTTSTMTAAIYKGNSTESQASHTDTISWHAVQMGPTVAAG